MASPTVGTAKVKILPDFAGFNQAYGAEMKKHFGNFASRQLAATGQDMTNAISKPLFNFFKDGLKVASDFYTTVGELSAIMAEQTGESYGKFASNQVTFMKDGERVKDSFVSGLREIARESKFSVDEMGQASTALARTGMRSQQDMIDFLSVSQKVAASNREELVATTEEMRTLSQVFGITGGVGISHIGDVITTVLTTSNMDLATFTEGMKRAGPVANALGLSIEDTAASIGVLGNVGFKGSTASTALKNAMIRLRSDIPNVTKVLEKYSIQTETAEGKSIPLVNVLEQMHDSGITTSDAFKLFGQVAGPAMAALLMPSNIEKIKILTKNMEEMQGVTDRLYERMKETPEFKLEALSSNFEELKLTIVDTFFPALSGGLDSANDKLTTFISIFQNLPDPIKKFSIAIGVAIMAAGPMALVLGKIGQSAGILKTAMSSLMPSMGAAYLAVGAALDGIGQKMIKIAQAPKLMSIMSSFAGGSGEMSKLRSAFVSLGTTAGKAFVGIGEGLFKIAQSGPLMTAITIAVLAFGYAWYKSAQEMKNVKKVQDDFSKISFDNLSKSIDQRKDINGQLTDLLAKGSGDPFAELMNSEDYQKTLNAMGITNQEFIDTLAKGGENAVETLAKVGVELQSTTRSNMERFGDFFNGNGEANYTDLSASIDRYNGLAERANNDLIANSGIYENEIRSHYARVKELVKADPTADNSTLKLVNRQDALDKDGYRLKDWEKIVTAYQEVNGKLVEVGVNSEKATSYLYATGEASQLFLYKAGDEFLRKNNLIQTKEFGTMKDITSARAEDIKNLTVEQIQAQMALSEEMQQAQADLTKNQSSLGIGANVDGFYELSTSEKEALPIMNALIASGQDMGQSLSYLQKITGITMPRAVELSNIKLDQMKGYIDIARQSLPKLGDVMSTFSEKDPPTMAKAMERLTTKYKDFATVQSKMKQLISKNGGEFSTLYQELLTLPADQQLSILKNLNMDDPAQLAELRAQQSALVTAKTTAAAEGVQNAVAAAAANNNTGVVLLDPISKAFSDLSKEINDSTMTPVISPQLDPAFVGYWNVVIARIKSLDPIAVATKAAPTPAFGPNSTYGFGRASGGPVWPGLKTSVNEIGREGFINSAGRFSMLPNVSSMRFNEYGTVVPASMVGGGRGGVTVVNHNNISGVTAQEVAEYQSSLTQAQVRRLGGGL